MVAGLHSSFRGRPMKDERIFQGIECLATFTLYVPFKITIEGKIRRYWFLRRVLVFKAICCRNYLLQSLNSVLKSLREIETVNRKF